MCVHIALRDVYGKRKKIIVETMNGSERTNNNYLAYIKIKIDCKQIFNIGNFMYVYIDLNRWSFDIILRNTFGIRYLCNN